MSYRYPKVCSDCGWPESRKVDVEACPDCHRNVCHVCPWSERTTKETEQEPEQERRAS